mgnify:CR=1 FL=1
MASSFRESFKSATSKPSLSSGSGSRPKATSAKPTAAATKSPTAKYGLVRMVSTPEATPAKRIKPAVPKNPKPSLRATVEPTMRAVNYAQTMRRHAMDKRAAAQKTARRANDPKQL